MGIDGCIESNLTLVGYWSTENIESLKGWWIHPKLLVRKGFYGDKKEKVVKYLRSGCLVFSYAGCSSCRLDSTIPDEVMGSGELTDGYWLWPEGLAVYVERFDVILPAEFLAYMSDNDYVPGKFILDPDDVVPVWGFWIGWCSAMKQTMNCDGINAPWRLPDYDDYENEIVILQCPNPANSGTEED